MNETKIKAAKIKAADMLPEVMKAVRECRRGNFRNFKLIGDYLRKNSVQLMHHNLGVSLKEYNFWAKAHTDNNKK